jgi:Zn-dependent protease
MNGLTFDRRELFDYVVAWLALGVAFTLFFEREILSNPSLLLSGALALNLLTVGVAFLLHELAHKVVAVHYDQVAAFRADYGMLFIAIMGGVVGFVFAAPGAVHHRGWLSEREGGLIALAGPAVNVVLVPVFAGLSLLEPALWRGVWVNALLAVFNLVPFGALDGKTVLSWSKPAYAGSMALALAVGAGVLLG